MNIQVFTYIIGTRPQGYYKKIPYWAAGCLSEGEARDGMSSRSQDFFGSFFHRVEKRDRKNDLNNQQIRK